jgi:hypothetical protein
MRARCWLLVRSLVGVGLALTFLGGCSTLRDIGVPHQPTLNDLDRVQEARAWIHRDRASLTAEIDALVARDALSSVDEEQLERDRQQLVELAEEEARLDATEEQTIQAIAADPIRARRISGQLDQRLTPMTRRYQLLQQRLVADQRQGQQPPARYRDEMADLRVRMDQVLEWQHRIVAASSGAARATDPGWPVLEGDARRRAREARDAIAGPGAEELE